MITATKPRAARAGALAPGAPRRVIAKLRGTTAVSGLAYWASMTAYRLVESKPGGGYHTFQVSSTPSAVFATNSSGIRNPVAVRPVTSARSKVATSRASAVARMTDSVGRLGVELL